MKPRTSLNHPLQIAALDAPGGGRIGMTFCPGKRDPAAMTGPWDRDLDTDLDAIVAWGASALVTLMEGHELAHLGVAHIGEASRDRGLGWYHLPIRDFSVPSDLFEQQWLDTGEALRARLARNESIVVHCKGGLGRTGLVAARLLIELGETPGRALARVRAVRVGAVETAEQVAYLLGITAL